MFYDSSSCSAGGLQCVIVVFSGNTRSLLCEVDRGFRISLLSFYSIKQPEITRLCCSNFEVSLFTDLFAVQ